MEQPALFNTMSQLVAQQCGEAVAEARRQATAEREQARADLARFGESRLALARKEAASRVRANSERAEAEAERHSLVIQEMVVDGLLDKVAEELRELTTRAEFPAIVGALLREAVEAASCAQPRSGPGGLIVTVPDAHKTRCEQLMNEMGLLTVEVRSHSRLADGVIVEDRAHTFRIANTLASRFERARNQARILCLERLFRGESAHDD